MFCGRCGYPLAEGDMFCGKCGYRMQDEQTPEMISKEPEAPEPAGSAPIVPEPVAPTPPVSEPVSPASVQMRPMKGRKTTGGGRRKIPLLIGAAVLAVILIVLAVRLLPGFYMRHFASPEDYFIYVEEKAVENGASFASSIYGNVLENMNLLDRSVSVDVGLSVDDDLLEMLSLFTQFDLSWLNNPGMSVNVSSKDQKAGMNAALSLEGEQIISLNAVYDLLEKEGYLQIPDLSGTYIRTDLENDLDQKALDAFRTFYAACPDEKTVRQLLNRYTMLALSCIQEVEKGKDTLKAEGVSQSCITLSVTIDEEVARDMAEAVLDELEKDQTVKQLIYQMSEALELDAEDTYDMFLELVKELSHETRDISDMDFEIQVVLYVGSGDVIQGADIEIELPYEGGYYAWSGETVNLRYAMPYQGSKVGFEAYASYRDQMISLVGSGKLSGKKLNGMLTLKYNGVGFVNIAVDDFQIAKLSKGQLDGCFTVTLTDVINTLLSTEIVRMDNLLIDVTDYGISFDVEMKDQSTSVKITALEKDQPMVALSVAYSTAAGKTVSIPSKDDSMRIRDEEDLIEWLETMNWDHLFDKLEKCNIPRRYLNQLEEAIEYLTDGNGYGYGNSEATSLIEESDYAEEAVQGFW